MKVGSDAGLWEGATEGAAFEVEAITRRAMPNCSKQSNRRRPTFSTGSLIWGRMRKQRQHRDSRCWRSCHAVRPKPRDHTGKKHAG
jgi:hypothetical protein